MTRLLVLGAGKIGGAIVDMLGATDDYELAVADRDPAFLAMVDPAKARHVQLDLADETALAKAAQGQEVLVSALPFFLNPAVARVARQVSSGTEHPFATNASRAPSRATPASVGDAPRSDSVPPRRMHA